MQAGTAAGDVGWRLWALVPIVLLGLAVAVVVSQGDRVVDLVGGSPPPADELDIRRVELRPGEIRVLVRNPQRDDVTIAVGHGRRRDRPVHARRRRRRSAGCARARSSSRTTGSRTSRSRSGSRPRPGSRRPTRSPAAVATPQPGARGFLGYGLIGLLVGVVPVALGLLWLPSLRRGEPGLARRVHGAHRRACSPSSASRRCSRRSSSRRRCPPSLGGPGLVLLGLAASALGMTFLSARLSPRAGRRQRPRARAPRRDRDRRPQPRRGPRDRDLVRDGRAPARRFPRDRLHGAQRHRGARDRRARVASAGDALAPRAARADRRRAGDPRHLDRGLRRRATC